MTHASQSATGDHKGRTARDSLMPRKCGLWQQRAFWDGKWFCEGKLRKLKIVAQLFVLVCRGHTRLQRTHVFLVAYTAIALDLQIHRESLAALGGKFLTENVKFKSGSLDIIVSNVLKL